MSIIFNKRSQSFTLLELLLGFTLFAVIAVSLYAVFANGLYLNRKAQKLDTLYREVRWLLETMTSDLENMVPYKYPPQGGSAAAGGFFADAESLTLVFPTKEGLEKVRYFLQPAEQSHIHQILVNRSTQRNIPINLRSENAERAEYLIREESPWGSSADGSLPENAESEVLSTHVRAGSLRFFYAQRDQQGTAGQLTWKDQWSEAYLPAGVRVILTLINPDDQDAPMEVQKDIIIPRGLWGTQSY